MTKIKKPKKKKQTKFKAKTESNAKSKSFKKKKTSQGHRASQEQTKPLSPELKKSLSKTNDQLDHWAKESQKLIESERPQTFQLDEWQQDAVNALLAGANVIVDAPTTAGKTRVVEAFFDKHIRDGNFRACYTCPVKSLSNDKLKEFRETFGREYVGIATGDIKENLNAAIVVATLESYRNSLLGVDPDLNRNLAIFDEYHFIQDGSRGSAWEESIILTPPECQMLLLSASLANAADFADWLEHLTKRPSVLITVKERPVPLMNLIWYGGKWFWDKALPASHLKQKTRYVKALNMQDIAVRAIGLIDLKLVPCIVYAGKRLSCEQLCYALAEHLEPISLERRQKIGEFIAQADKESSVLSFLSPKQRTLIQSYGVSYHHSGLTPPVRVLIESLVKEGLLTFCVATMGLSLGINFSVKSVIISDIRRPGDGGLTAYSPSEVLQMTGRAGRRGRDLIGFSCWLSTGYYEKFGKAKRDACESRLKNDPTTFLGLVSRGFSLSLIEKFYGKSFLKFKNPRTDLTLINPSRLKKSLKASQLPCIAPVHEFTSYHASQNADCYDCNYRKKCHHNIESLLTGDLALLQAHLHDVDSLNKEGGLSDFGEIARYFPQSGGLYIANMISRDEINPGNLLESIQLMAALSLIHFKSPNVPQRAYKFPFSKQMTLKNLKIFYPEYLFPEAYEESRYDNKMIYKEFNPQAGYILQQWGDGIAWADLNKEVTTEHYRTGDIMSLIYRTASYLQSMYQADLGELSILSKELREFLLREPIQTSL